MGSEFKISYAILCDDIRKEDNGKAILIGVYSGDLVLAKPGGMPLVFWVQGESFSEDRSVRFQVRLLDESGEPKFYSQALVQVTGEKDPVMLLSGIYMIPHAGWLVLEYEQNEKWKEVLRKKIEILSAAPTEPEQPSSQSLPAPP